MRTLTFLTAILIAVLLMPMSSAAEEVIPPDWDIPGGHFYTQANGKGGAGGTGFSVADEGGIPFWSEFQRLGGVPALGYPISHRFQMDGFTVQAFQKEIMQWQPGQGMFLVNIYDRMSEAGKDSSLDVLRQTPPTFDDSADRGLPWEKVVQRHLALLGANPAIKERYLADSDPILHYGLPLSYKDYGAVFVVRAQRAVFQQWKGDTPWARAGEVVMANGGDIAKEFGMFPQEATWPEAPRFNSPGTWKVEMQGDLPPGYSGTLTPGRLTFPHAMAVDGSGNLYVTDWVSHTVQKLSPEGALLSEWKGLGPSDQVAGPNGVAIDPAGNVLVVDVSTQEILSFSPSGELLAHWKSGRGDGIAVDRTGNIYLAQGNAIAKFSPTGQLLARWTSERLQPEATQYLAVDSAGNVYDSQGRWAGSTGPYVARIVKFSASGELVAEWGGWGNELGKFADPKGIAVDGDDNVYVADWGNFRVQKFSPSGQLLAVWGGMGQEPGQFKSPQAVAVDAAGTLHVVEQGNHRIQRLAINQPCRRNLPLIQYNSGTLRPLPPEKP